MSSERPEACDTQATVLVRGDAIGDQKPKSPSNTAAAPNQETSGDAQSSGSAGNKNGSDDASRRQTTVLVHGETIQEPGSKSQAKDSQTKDSQPKDKASGKKVSEAKATLQARLPALDDDSAVGVPKEQVVTRDGKADLAFTGTLLASAAPPSAPKGTWQEYRIYETNGAKHVFSKITRSVYAEEQDTHEAEIFDPSPSSVPSQLLRSARDLTRSRPLTWKDAAVDFFGYDELAKALYRKLSGQFEEHIG